MRMFRSSDGVGRSGWSKYIKVKLFEKEGMKRIVNGGTILGLCLQLKSPAQMALSA